MMDAYSFDLDARGGQEAYVAMRAAYARIMERLGLPYYFVAADSGEIGGDYSEMAVVPAAVGDDYILQDEEGLWHEVDATAEGALRVIEVGHLFQLGTRYTAPLQAQVTTAEGVQTLYGGCYGIGISRLLATVLEHHHDERGIVWPRAVAPYDCTLLPLNESDAVTNLSVQLEEQLTAAGLRVLVDWRDERPGAKFAAAALMGSPWSIVIGRGAAEGIVDLEARTGERETLSVQALLDSTDRLMN
jgi:prolyl-tRNA synthetase